MTHYRTVLDSSLKFVFTNQTPGWLDCKIEGCHPWDLVSDEEEALYGIKDLWLSCVFNPRVHWAGMFSGNYVVSLVRQFRGGFYSDHWAFPGDLGLLSNRERGVLISVGRWFSVTAAADELGISNSTARTHIARTQVKIGKLDHAELMEMAFIYSTMCRELSPHSSPSCAACAHCVCVT